MEDDYADISKLDSVTLQNIRRIRKNVWVDLNTRHVFITKYDSKLSDKKMTEKVLCKIPNFALSQSFKNENMHAVDK